MLPSHSNSAKLVHDNAKPAHISDDYDALWLLASAYQAWTTTATDPVVLAIDFYAQKDLNTKEVFSHIYYDCHNDEAFAHTVMQERIHNASQDILKHLNAHTDAWQNFAAMQTALHKNDRTAVVTTAQNICSLTRSYTGIVKHHQQQRDADAFLTYPAAISGHLFYRRGAPEMRGLQWNPQRTYGGNAKSLAVLERLLPFFEHTTTDISDVSLSHIPNNDLFRQHLRTAFMLLERAGFRNIPQRLHQYILEDARPLEA